MMERLLISKGCQLRVYSFTVNDNNTLSLWTSTNLSDSTILPFYLHQMESHILHGMKGLDLLLVTPQGYIDYFATLIPQRNIPAGFPVHTHPHPRPHPHLDPQWVSPCIRKIDAHRQSKWGAGLLTTPPDCDCGHHLKCSRLLQIVDTSRQIHAGNDTKITRKRKMTTRFF